MSSMGIHADRRDHGTVCCRRAYLPIMSDEAMIVDKTGSVFLAGPFLVKAAIGEEIDH